jgi:hypothetical protein
MSSTNRPAVAPTVPSLMIFSSPVKESVKTRRAESISRMTGLRLEQRLVEDAGRLEQDAAGELDEERGGLRDDGELPLRGAALVPGRVLPAAGVERDGDLARRDRRAVVLVAELRRRQLDDADEVEVLGAGARERQVVRTERPDEDGRTARRRVLDLDRDQAAVAEVLEILAVHDLAVLGAGQRAGRRLDREFLELLLVRVAAAVGEGAGEEGDLVPAGGEGAREREAVGVARADADRARERQERPGRVAELELVAVDRRVVDEEAVAAAEDDLEVARPVDRGRADR